VPVLTTAVWQLALQNAGSANLEIQNIQSNNASFSTSFRQLTIVPNSQQQVQIKFTPNNLQAQTATLTISSNDPNNSQVTVALSGKGVDTLPPAITLQPSSQQLWVNTDFQISIQVIDNGLTSSVSLYYRKGTEISYHPTAMNPLHSDIYSASIPGSFLTFEGITYFIRAEDSSVNTASSDTLSQKIYFPAGALTTNLPIGAYKTGYPRGKWYMVSVPAALNSAGVSSVLNDESELGSYGEPNWRLFSYEDTNRDGIKDGYWEYNSADEAAYFQFQPGKAFWLKANPNGEKIEIDVEAGYVLPLEPITISLKLGWNQVGNPFAFPIAFSPSESNIVDKLYSPDGAGGYSLLETMTPFAGYFVYVAGTQQTSLTLYPVYFSLLPKPLVEDCDWLVQLRASCGICQDQINYFGISKSSADDWDKRDYPEPPKIGDFISLYFPHGDWESQCKNFTSDFRPEIEDGQIWDLVIETNQINLPIKIEWLKNIESDLKFTLHDKKRHQTIDMTSCSEYSYSLMPGENSSLFQILAGNQRFVDARMEELQAQLPQNFSLQQNYPNPFNTSTNISFDLPTASAIRLILFNRLGKEIKTMLEGKYKAGHYEIVFNASDLASGLYLYKFETGSFRAVKKLLILK
jgi:hypothetical protein